MWKLSWMLWKNYVCDQSEPRNWINTVQDGYKHSELESVHVQVALHIGNFYSLWRNSK